MLRYFTSNLITPQTSSLVPHTKICQWNTLKTNITNKMSITKGKKASYQEGRVLLAIKALEKGQFSSFEAALCMYKIPHSTLVDWQHLCTMWKDSQSRNWKLTSTEQLFLVQQIISMDECGLPSQVSTVWERANFLLASLNASATPPTISPVSPITLISALSWFIPLLMQWSQCTDNVLNPKPQQSPSPTVYAACPITSATYGWEHCLGLHKGTQKSRWITNQIAMRGVNSSLKLRTSLVPGLHKASKPWHQWWTSPHSALQTNCQMMETEMGKMKSPVGRRTGYPAGR